MSSSFVSKELKSAATDMEATVTLGGDGWDQTYTVTVTGRSRQKWDPEPLSPARVYVSQMTEADVAALLPGAALHFATLMGEYLTAEPAAAATPEASATPAPDVSAPAADATAAPATDASADAEPGAAAEADTTETPAPATEAPASVTEAPASATDTPAA